MLPKERALPVISTPRSHPQFSGQFLSGKTCWLFYTWRTLYDQKTRSHWYFTTVDSKTFSWAVYMYQHYHSINVFHYTLSHETRIILLVYSLVYTLLDCQLCSINKPFITFLDFQRDYRRDKDLCLSSIVYLLKLKPPNLWQFRRPETGTAIVSKYHCYTLKHSILSQNLPITSYITS